MSVTTELIPAAQRSEIGFVVNNPPFELPQTPLIGSGALFAEQVALVPKNNPSHDQFHAEPVKVRFALIPESQRFTGLVTSIFVLSEPQAPLIGSGVLITSILNDPVENNAGVPLSVTRTTAVNDPVHSVFVGVQVNTPVLGSIVAPV